MKRDVIGVGLLWLVLTALGELFAVFVDFYPVARSDKGEEIEHAFRVLVYFAVPVFAFVVATLVSTVLRRRTTEPLDGDGLPLRGHGPVPLAWFAITTALTLAIMVYPGLVSVPDIFGGEEDADLVVEVEGMQWAWSVSYPELGLARLNELVLPVDREVRFEITSQDVLHSFWIPGFLMKIDAVPGMTTAFSLVPTKEGSFETDPNLRVQCAELCGVFHAGMRIPVRVVSEAEFEAWVQEQAAAAPSGEGPTSAPDAQRVTIVADDLAFDLREIEVEAGRPVVITFENRDDGVPHNWALYENEEAARERAEAFAASPVEEGPVEHEIVFEALSPGTYYFLCEVHPNMNGELVVP